MQLIDEHADAELMKTLEATSAYRGVEGGFYMQFQLAGKVFTGASTPKIHMLIAGAALNHLDTAQVRIYFCEDGDCYVLTPNMPEKYLRLMALEVAVHLNIPADSHFVIIRELEVHAQELLETLRQKTEKRRVAARALAQQYTEDKARTALRDARDSDAEPHQVAQRRQHRTQPELMIVGGDPFNRRLMENALNPDFSLTVLEDAERALATYAALAPDILFLASDLPQVAEPELLARIMHIDPEAYIVMLKGEANTAAVYSAIHAGAKGFIEQPFNREKLLQCIARCPALKRSVS